MTEKHGIKKPRRTYFKIHISKIELPGVMKRMICQWGSIFPGHSIIYTKTDNVLVTRDATNPPKAELGDTGHIEIDAT